MAPTRAHQCRMKLTRNHEKDDGSGQSCEEIKSPFLRKVLCQACEPLRYRTPSVLKFVGWNGSRLNLILRQLPRQPPCYAPVSMVLEALNFRIVRERRSSLERKNPPIRPNSEPGFPVNFLGSWGCYAPYKSCMCFQQSSPQ